MTNYLSSAFNSFIVCILVFISSTGLFAQQAHIGGVINKYAAVITMAVCDNTVTVNNTTGFFVGQKVLIMQMRGAQIDLTNTATFGNITNYKTSGNYEIETIKSITGNVIEFVYVMKRRYDVSGLVQLVSVEEYATAIIDSTLRAKTWDGTSGGVLMLQADTLILNDSITVKGLGFKGAVAINDGNGQACFNGGVGGATIYFCSTIECGAPKGEGAGNSPFGFGRGKNGNGGGGGNDHNTGGGGGSNFGAGGRGGIRSNVSNFSCPGPAPGEGGAALIYSNVLNKIFMGGGGGAGDQNNTQGTSGADGGGIVFIIADVLVGNNNKINANGNNVTVLARSDGAGGGGGAGTVLLSVNSYVGNITVNANGGKGGNLNNGNDPNFCFGPGGGGAGGTLWVKTSSVSANITLIDTGGLQGKVTYALANANCPFGSSNGALRGNAGGSITNLSVPVANAPFEKLVAEACCDTTVCVGSSIIMSANASGSSNPTFLWSNGSTSGTFIEQVNSTVVYTLTVSDTTGCQLLFSHTATVLNLPPNLTVCCDTNVCPGATIQLQAITTSQPVTYNWNTGETTNIISPTIVSNSTFTVIITDVNGCKATSSAQVTVSNIAPNLSVCCDTTVCAGATVQLQANTNATTPTYFWNNSANTASISVPVFTSNTFSVLVTDFSGCIATASVNVTVVSPTVTVTAIPDTAILLGQSAQLTATQNTTYTYLWSPENGLNNAGIYNPLATPNTTTIYCVTVTDATNCTAEACKTIDLIIPEIKIPDAFSPNNDGNNDVLTLFQLKYAEIYEVRIYNRWGEVIFEALGNQAWDGTFKGARQQNGTYVCEVMYGSKLNPGKINRAVKDIVLVQ